jgi:curved DNA-binding protein CbpA
VHPNKGGDEAKFKMAKEAFEYLKDPDNRSLYNGKKTQLSLTNEKQLFLKNNNVNAKQWTKYSDDKDTWYTNKKNPISVWEKDLPKNAIVDENPPEFWAVGESDDKSWVKLEDSYGHITFYSKADKQASWESPIGVEIKDLAVRRRVLSENVKLPDPPK